MEIVKPSGSLGKFYPNLPKTFLELKMSKNKAHIWNEDPLNTRNIHF